MIPIGASVFINNPKHVCHGQSGIFTAMSGSGKYLLVTVGLRTYRLLRSEVLYISNEERRAWAWYTQLSERELALCIAYHLNPSPDSLAAWNEAHELP